MKQQFFVIGHPLGHSMSPFIHSRLFVLQGKDADYGAKEISPDKLRDELPALLNQAGGLNVTIPYKQEVIPFLEKMEGRAALYRSVNTIAITPEGYIGHNTDASGFLHALEEGQIALRGRVAILGCGGAGRTFACEAARAGCTIVNAVREPNSASVELKTYVQSLVPGTDMETVRLDELNGDFDLLINATPVGMFPHADACPVSEAVLSRTAAVFDAVYNPHPTRLLSLAQANGCRIARGMAMLVWQAAEAHTIWYGARFRAEDMATLIEEAIAAMPH